MFRVCFATIVAQFTLHDKYYYKMFPCKFCECPVITMNVWLIDRAYHQDIDAVCNAAHHLIDILIEEYNSGNRPAYYVVYVCTGSSHINMEFLDEHNDVSNYVENINYICKLFEDFNSYQYRNNTIYNMNNISFDESHVETVRNFKDIAGDKDSMHDIISSLKVRNSITPPLV